VLRQLSPIINRVTPDLFHLIHRTHGSRNLDFFRKIRPIESFAISSQICVAKAELTEVDEILLQHSIVSVGSGRNSVTLVDFDGHDSGANQNRVHRGLLCSAAAPAEFLESAVLHDLGSLFSPGHPRRKLQNGPMQIFLSWLSVIASPFLIVRLLLTRPLVSGTTLSYSWGWSIVASLTLLASTWISVAFHGASTSLTTAVQYLSVIMLLTPAISTLGARKPGVGTWQWFVVLPLILVLQWPATTQLLSSRGREALDLGAPQTTGILLVLLMSAGTGVGTTLTLSTILYMIGVVFCLLPSSGWIDPASSLPLWSPILLLTGEMITTKIIRERYHAIRTGTSGIAVTDAVWMLFQDLYGVIWARRVLDRVNQFSIREQWTVSLTWSGFRRADGSVPEDRELQKPIEAFRWVLGRFADEAWLQTVLGRFC